MKSFDGYLKKKLGDSYVLLAGGGEKSLNDFLLKAVGGTISAAVTIDVNATYPLTLKGSSSYTVIHLLDKNSTHLSDIGYRADNSMTYMANINNLGIISVDGTGAYYSDASNNFKKYKLLHSGDWTSTIDGRYLPLTAGSSYPLTDTLYINRSNTTTSPILSMTSGLNEICYLEMKTKDKRYINFGFMAGNSWGIPDTGGAYLWTSGNSNQGGIFISGSGLYYTNSASDFDKWAVFHENNLQPYPKGFSGVQTTNNWIRSNDDTFTLLMGWQEPSGGETSFYTNGNGLMFQAIDGAFYQRRDSGGSWRCADLHDLESYPTTTVADAKYVLKEGDTMTGDLKMGGTKNLSHPVWDKGLIAGHDGHAKVVATYLASNTSGATIGAHNSNLTAWDILNITGTQLVFRYGNAEAEGMRLNSSGNLGIGVSPSYRLHIKYNTTSAAPIFEMENTTFTAADSYGWASDATFSALSATSRVVHEIGKASSANNKAWWGYYHKGDGNAGNAFIVGIYGTYELFSVLANGNVGVGTVAPSYKLLVNGSQTYVNGNATEVGYLINNSYSSDCFGVLRNFYNGSDWGAIHFFNTAYLGYSHCNKCINIDPYSGNYISLGNWTNPALFITRSNGRIGMGTTSPSYKVHVVGDSYFNGEAYFKSLSASQTIRIGYNTATWYGGASTHPMIWGGDGSTYYTMIAMPHIPFLLNGYNSYTGGTYGAIIRYASTYGTSGTSWDCGVPTSDLFEIKRASSRFLAINSSGNVGINNVSPSYKLDVSGTARATTMLIGPTINSNYLMVYGNHSAPGLAMDSNDRPAVYICGYYPLMMLMAGGSGNANYGATISLGAYDSGKTGTFSAFTIGTAGLNVSKLDIGFGNNSNPHYHGMNGLVSGTGVRIININKDKTVTFYGNVYAVNYYTTSDRSKKQNISSFSEHIRKFQLKDTEKWHYGVIAQEVEEMFRDGEEGSMTVNYNSVLSFYIGLLENRVKELEDKLKKYEEIQNI